MLLGHGSLTQRDKSVRMGEATFRNQEANSMRLTFIGKDPDSNPTGSPTVYRTDRGSWVVQGWLVTDPEALAQMNIPDGEGCVEIPDRLVQFFR